MNLPNRLTLARILLAPFFVIAMGLDFSGSKSIALFIFLIAVVTDYLDGSIARSRGLITDFGKLMDPLADKILTASAFILLIPVGAMPAWAVILIISREFLITGLRSLANSHGKVLPAERLGKHKTGWQMATILFFLILLAVAEVPGGTVDQSEWFGFLWMKAGTALVVITTALTVYSGAAYFWKNRDLISNR